MAAEDAIGRNDSTSVVVAALLRDNDAIAADAAVSDTPWTAVLDNLNSELMQKVRREFVDSAVRKLDIMAPRREFANPANVVNNYDYKWVMAPRGGNIDANFYRKRVIVYWESSNASSLLFVENVMESILQKLKRPKRLQPKRSWLNYLPVGDDSKMTTLTWIWIRNNKGCGAP